MNAIVISYTKFTHLPNCYPCSIQISLPEFTTGAYELLVIGNG